VDGAAGAVAGQLRQIERLGDDTLPGERGVAVDEERQDGEGLRVRLPVLLGTHDPFDDRIDRLEVRRVRGERDGERRAVRTAPPALGALVVLHVARSLDGLRVEVPLEFAEDLGVGLADDVGEHVQVPAVRHAEDDLRDPGVGGRVEHGVEERDRRLGAFEAEALLTDVAQVEERLEGLRGIQAAEDVPLLRGRHRLRGALDVVLDPELLLGALDVHVLHADRSAVGVAQDLEDLRQRQDLAPREPEGVKTAFEILRAEPVLTGVKVRAQLARFALERVETRDEMAAHPVHVDERPDHQLPRQLVAVGACGRLAAGLPPRLDRDAERGEDLVVKAVATDEQLVDAAQEQARFGPLDDPVVVGRRQRDDLLDAESTQGLRRGRLELDGVVERADADDRALTPHEPRHRLGRAEGAGVRYRHRHAGEVLDRELPGP
jgi:hypothetical protein